MTEMQGEVSSRSSVSGPNRLRGVRGRVNRAVRDATPGRVRRVVEAADYRRRKLASRNPRTFTEKIVYKMLRDHRPLLTTFSDKIAVRDYVATKVGAEFLPGLHAVVEDPRDLVLKELPREFVVKAAHSSGGVVVVTDGAPAGEELPELGSGWTHSTVRRENLDRDRLVRLCDSWLAGEYGGGPFHEWSYVHVPRRILVEEFLRDERGAIPADFKFFVFHAKCRLVQVDTGRYGEHRQNFFTPAWNPVAVELVAPPASVPPPRPATLELMIDVAERLAVDTDFVRVDLYEIGSRVVFGELTSFPQGGKYSFHPASFEAEMGSWWNPPSVYR